MADKSAIGGPEHVCGMSCDGQDRGGGCDVQDRWRAQNTFFNVKWTEADPNQYVGMIGIPQPPVTTTLVDAHAQMLAARVEGLEKDVNSLQHVWPRLKAIEPLWPRLIALESEVARLSSAKPSYQNEAAVSLLKRCLFELPTTSDLVGCIAEFLRNR
jgi:hypothetical protein